MTLWTIGHSNRSISEFLELLSGEQIELVADVRRFPGSRKHPQFAPDALRTSLAEVGFDYRHFPDLGGRRGQPRADSPNRGWRVVSFNAYADYMASGEFAAAFDQLAAEAAARRTCVMCAEAVPWRCHRRLIADAFIVRGWEVRDITGKGAARPHAMTPFARVESDGRLIYPTGAAE